MIRPAPQKRARFFGKRRGICSGGPPKKSRNFCVVDEEKQNLLRERELKIKRRKLVNRLEMRPRDQKSLMQLVDIAYELEDYFSVCTLIKRAPTAPEGKLAQYIQLRDVR